MIKKRFFFIFIFFPFFLMVCFLKQDSFVAPSYGVVTELSAGYTYLKRKYGTTRENLIVEKGKSGSIAFYLFAYTALDFSYFSSQNINTNNDRLSTSVNGLYVAQMETTVYTEIWGGGIKQLLAPRTSFLSPQIGLSYVKQSVRSKRIIIYEANSVQIPMTAEDPRITYGRAMAMFGLKINLSVRFSLNFSVRSIFKAFEWNQMSDDLRYETGLSWYF